LQIFNSEVTLIRDQVWINVGAYDSKWLTRMPRVEFWSLDIWSSNLGAENSYIASQAAYHRWNIPQL